MKKKILHILFTSEFGGAEKVAMDLIKISSDGYDSTYLSKKGTIDSFLEKESIEFQTVDKINYLVLRKIIKEKDIDIIHAHDFRASLLSSLFFKNKIIISHIHQSPLWFSEKNIKTILYNIALRRINSVIVTSLEIKKSFPYTKNSKNFFVLPNYVDTPYYNFERKIYDFAFVGRLEMDKNPKGFLDFFKLMKLKNDNLNGIIIGKGTLFNEIKNIKTEENLNISLVGFQKNPHQYLNKSKFLVVTSVKEGFGLAIIESMQLGVPVITKRIGGVTELLDYTNAIIIDDFNDWRAQLDILLLNENEYTRMSKKAKIFGNRYRNKNEIKRNLENIYDSESVTL